MGSLVEKGFPRKAGWILTLLVSFPVVGRTDSVFEKLEDLEVALGKILTEAPDRILGFEIRHLVIGKKVRDVDFFFPLDGVAQSVGSSGQTAFCTRWSSETIWSVDFNSLAALDDTVDYVIAVRGGLREDLETLVSLKLGKIAGVEDIP